MTAGDLNPRESRRAGRACRSRISSSAMLRRGPPPIQAPPRGASGAPASSMDSPPPIRAPPRGASGAPASMGAPAPPIQAPPRGASGAPASKEALASPKEAAPATSLLRAPPPTSKEPRRNPHRGARASSSATSVPLQSISKEPISKETLSPLEIALSGSVRPRVRFVTHHTVPPKVTSAPAEDKVTTATAEEEKSTVPTSSSSNEEKRLFRMKSLQAKYKGIGRIGYESDRKILAVIYDEEMTLHEPPQDYMKLEDVESENEKPERLTYIMDKLIEENLLNRFDLFKPDEAATNCLLAVHECEHVKTIESLWTKSADERKALVNGADVYYCRGSGRAAFLAAGGAIKASTLVVEGLYEHSFAVIRPPGHHAGKKGSSGFCLLNNIAIAATHLIQKYEKKRIVIFDMDIHHGNGTQELFYDENNVLFISIHRSEKRFYPFAADGDVENIGNGPGRGFNVNCCLRCGAGDGDYYAILEGIVIPLIESYGPDIILISAGFDAAAGDPLGGCKVTPSGYATIIEMLMRFGSLVLVLEGGYEFNVLAECVSACIKVLSGDKTSVAFERAARPSRSTVQMIKETKEKLSEVWEIFKEDGKKAVDRPQREEQTSCQDSVDQK